MVELASQILTFAGAFGLGSVVSSIVQWKIRKIDNKQNQKYQEKRDAYIGLLDSYRKAAIESSHENRMDFAYWILRCELVAEKDLLNKIYAFQTASGTTKFSKNIEQELLEAIRHELQ